MHFFSPSFSSFRHPQPHSLPPVSGNTKMLRKGKQDESGRKSVAAQLGLWDEYGFLFTAVRMPRYAKIDEEYLLTTLPRHRAKREKVRGQVTANNGVQRGGEVWVGLVGRSGRSHAWGRFFGPCEGGGIKDRGKKEGGGKNQYLHALISKGNRNPRAIGKYCHFVKYRLRVRAAGSSMAREDLINNVLGQILLSVRVTGKC